MNDQYIQETIYENDEMNNISEKIEESDDNDDDDDDDDDDDIILYEIDEMNDDAMNDISGADDSNVDEKTERKREADTCRQGRDKRGNYQV